ncbi:MAG: pyruvate dehydrogenase (acetyl-transferring) E1 component subunit alpha [Bifidobacteriaceae bacterium]|jgi:pyruvate dehydrogenase E1 component alpha subunit|nr:pyruvate dehydrogenase (acetyl-transferring) E1 component subunit alpha [Bifidobacteriaceae bacterium]
MYRDMVLTRAFDTQATALQRQGKLALWPPSLGQEAAQVGSAHAVSAEDWVFPSYREHGVLQARGVDLTESLALFRGTDHGGWDTERPRTHLYTLVVGAQALHAVGYAMGMALDGAPGAAVVYLGDGATSQGEFSEALVWAASAQAPVLFFIQNNGWAISTPAATQARVPLARRGEGFGIPGERVDGNDVAACYDVTAAALETVRAGQGPRIIEALTYRMGPHTTSDDPSRYRTHDQEAEWATRDPVARARAALAASGLADQAFFDEADAAGARLAERARERCAALEAPPFGAFFDWAYATPHRLVAEERAARERESGVMAPALALAGAGL